MNGLMPVTEGAGRETTWKALRYFNLYRMTLADGLTMRL